MGFKQILITALCFSSAVLAQQPLDPLNAAEIDLVRGALLTNTTVRQSLGASPRYAIVNVERHLEAKGAAPAGRRADVILYNYATSETISAVVSLAGTLRIDALRVTKDLPPPLGAAEAETAKQLALANATVRTRLQAAGLSDSDPTLVVTHLFGRAEDPRDPCSRNRCVLLFFNSRTALLFSAAVDLTENSVRAIDAPER